MCCEHGSLFKIEHNKNLHLVITCCVTNKITHSLQHRDKIIVEGYRFLFKFGKKPTVKNISRNFSGKYSQKLFNKFKKSPAHTSKPASKTAEGTGNSNGSKFRDKFRRAESGSAPGTVSSQTEDIKLNAPT